MEKRVTNITKMTITYAAVVVGLVVATTLAWAIALATSILPGGGDGESMRADAVERQVYAWVNEQRAGELDFESFPEGAEYVFKDAEGKTISCKTEKDDDPELESIILMMEKNDLGQYARGREIYLRVLSADDVLYIHYSLRVKNEWTWFFAALLCYVIDFVVPTVIFINKTKRNIRKVNSYAAVLGDKNLDVPAIKTQIEELNEVTATMEMMRHELQTAMEAGWAEEQAKKEAMALMAHDLKTPLTIIRGNADLLLEEALETAKAGGGKSESSAAGEMPGGLGAEGSEEVEALRTIISNCERIAQTILEIIAK